MWLSSLCFLLRYAFLLPLIFYGIDIDYAQFFIFLSLFVCVCFGFLGFKDSSLFLRFLVFMVNSFEVRVACPSISFFFARLGASLSASCVFFPLVENFVSEGSS